MKSRTLPLLAWLKPDPSRHAEERNGTITSYVIFDLFKREVTYLYQVSLIFRLFRINDRVQALRYSPLGMFFYNQRAIFFGFGLFFLSLLQFCLWRFPPVVGAQAREMQETIIVLLVFWALGAAITIGLHWTFIRKLKEWASPLGVDRFLPIPDSRMRKFRKDSPLRASDRLPPMFDLYVLLDSVMIISLVITGRIRHLNLDAFTLLLLANLVIFSAYAGGGRRLIFLVLVLPVWVFLVTVLLLPGTLSLFAPATDPGPDGGAPHLFYLILNFAPRLSMAAMTVFSVLMISWLRTTEHRSTQRHLTMLGKYANTLTSDGARHSTPRGEHDVEHCTEQCFRDRISDVFADLCDPMAPFWYDSACLWFIERRENQELLLPGPRFNFDEAKNYREGIPSDGAFLKCADEVILVQSLKSLSESLSREQSIQPQFRQDVDAPAAFIPLHRNNNRIGVISLYGQAGGLPLQLREAAFLRSLGSIIFNIMEQWEGRYRVLPLREMDGLFTCETLDELFHKAAKILRDHLMAAGCLVLCREDFVKPEMKVAAREGFTNLISKYRYLVGEGRTGKCAETGSTDRCDDVPGHRDQFDPEHLNHLEKAHGGPILSWMAIPIGTHGENYGVIEVVNHTLDCDWFTDEDQKLGEELAFRLQVVIDRFRHVKETEDAGREAERQAQQAQEARKRAEAAARQRSDDLMVITHQLQGPLSSAVSAITYLQGKPLAKNVEESLTKIHGLVEDCLALCFGTFSAFAHEAGQETAFESAEVDAPAELKKLCERLQLTNARDDLTFGYYQEPGFPALRLDRNLFTSVMYSLIHNAMKYADKHSEVSLVCSYERSTGEAVLKVKSKGEPIHPNETEAIFKKFRRGRVIAKTGRHHSGVGLGLWVARELMREIEGDLTVELSPKEPRLSVFIVHIPREKV